MKSFSVIFKHIPSSYEVIAEDRVTARKIALERRKRDFESAGIDHIVNRGTKSINIGNILITGNRVSRSIRKGDI